jgi:hypothetical protein
MENGCALHKDLKIDYMVDQNVYIKSSLLSRILAKLGHSSLALSHSRKTNTITKCPMLRA